MKYHRTPMGAACPADRPLSVTAKSVFTMLTALVLLAATMLLSSCASTPALAVQNEPTQRVQTDAFALTLTFLDEAELMRRHGQRDNLFIAPQGLLMPERFIPFDVTLTSSGGPLILALNQIEISYGGRTANPTNQFHFGLYWEQRDQEGSVSGSDVNARQRLIRQTVAPNRIRVAGGASESSMLLFRGNFPQFGTATITVVVLDETDRPVDRAVFTFEF
ncbi:MAG: hypothetical protein EA403_03365 [Spirochaetaceae bacterium]|nr:MAG: hypothetical protein EA403_03365 [Spirochaetaceae bacterium]